MAPGGGGKVWSHAAASSWFLVSSSLRYCSSRRIKTSFTITSCTTRTARSMSLRPTAASSSARLIPPLIDVDCNLWHDDLQQPLFPIERKGTTSTASTDTTLLQQTPLSILQVLEQDAVLEHNIVAMISPSSTIQDAKRGLEFLATLYGSKSDDDDQQFDDSTSRRFPLIRTTVGVHPYHVNDDTEDKHHGDTLLHRIESTMQQAREMVQQYNFSDKKFIVAIGECGLDATPGFPPISDQLPWFKAQVELAQALQLPLFVHERLALRETLQILDNMTRPVPVLIHCFTGGPVECHEYEQRGYSISFSGSILKPGDANEMTRQCLRDRIPSRLMIETDAPYMGFPNSRKYYLQKQESQLATLTSKQRKRLQTSLYPNVPSSLVAVLDEVVALLNAPNNGQRQPLTREEVAHQTTRNAIAFFGLDLDL